MLWLFYWIALFAFLLYASRIARRDGLRLPLIFISIWLLGYFGFPLLGIYGNFYFIALQALLSLVMIFIDLYRENSNTRKPPKIPLSSVENPDT